MKFRMLALAATAAALSQAPLPASAADDTAFFNGKTITYIVATAPGGGYDSYGRLVAEYMQKYLPGSTVVVKNVPGAGHIIGANTIYASKPDGLTIGTFNTGLIYNQLVKAPEIKFDLNKMGWIGKAASDPRVIAVAAQSPVKSYGELMASKDTLNFSTAGIGSASYVETTMLASALKMPVKIQTGYNGADDQLAMRRGEIVGSIASRSSYETFVKNGFGRFIAQIGGNDKDVPQLSPQISDPKGKQLVALIQSQGDIARLTAGPPDMPADRLAALRTAYRKAMDDKELQERAAKLERPVEPLIGDDVLKAVQAALNQTPETVKLLDEALKAK